MLGRYNQDGKTRILIFMLGPGGPPVLYDVTVGMFQFVPAVARLRIGQYVRMLRLPWPVLA